MNKSNIRNIIQDIIKEELQKKQSEGLLSTIAGTAGLALMTLFPNASAAQVKDPAVISQTFQLGSIVLPSSFQNFRTVYMNGGEQNGDWFKQIAEKMGKSKASNFVERIKRVPRGAEDLSPDSKEYNESWLEQLKGITDSGEYSQFFNQAQNEQEMQNNQYPQAPENITQDVKPDPDAAKKSSLQQGIQKLDKTINDINVKLQPLMKKKADFEGKKAKLQDALTNLQKGNAV